MRYQLSETAQHAAHCSAKTLALITLPSWLVWQESINRTRIACLYSTCFFVLDCCELRMRDVGTRLRISCWAYEKVSLGLSSCALQLATYLNDQLNYSLARLRLTGQAPFQHWLLVVLPTNGMSCKFPSWKFRRERERERQSMLTVMEIPLVGSC